jgi:hypothetical protein
MMPFLVSLQFLVEPGVLVTVLSALFVKQAASSWVFLFFFKKQICYISKRVPVILKGKSATRPKFESYQKKKNPKKPYILLTSLAKCFAPAKIQVCGLISNPRGNYHGEFLKMIKKT